MNKNNIINILMAGGSVTHPYKTTPNSFVNQITITPIVTDTRGLIFITKTPNVPYKEHTKVDEAAMFYLDAVYSTENFSAYWNETKEYFYNQGIVIDFQSSEDIVKFEEKRREIGEIEIDDELQKQ